MLTDIPKHKRLNSLDKSCVESYLPFCKKGELEEEEEGFFLEMARWMHEEGKILTSKCHPNPE